MDRDTLDAERRLQGLLAVALAEMEDQPPETDRALAVVVKVVAPLDVRIRTLEEDIGALKLALSQLIR